MCEPFPESHKVVYCFSYSGSLGCLDERPGLAGGYPGLLKRPEGQRSTVAGKPGSLQVSVLCLAPQKYLTLLLQILPPCCLEIRSLAKDCMFCLDGNKDNSACSSGWHCSVRSATLGGKGCGVLKRSHYLGILLH